MQNRIDGIDRIKSIVQDNVGNVPALCAFVNSIEEVLGARKVQVVVQHERRISNPDEAMALKDDVLEPMVNTIVSALKTAGYSVSDKEDISIEVEGNFLTAAFRTNKTPVVQEEPVEETPVAEEQENQPTAIPLGAAGNRI